MVVLDPELAEVAPTLRPADLTDPSAARALNRERRAADPDDQVRERLEVTDGEIPGPDVAIPVRYYRPRATSGPVPAVVWLHGGAFIVGDLNSSDALCARISDEVGALVVNVDYRLAPEHPAPAGLADCYAVLRWVAANAGELGVDPDWIGLAGASAGGCLAAGTALLARDRGGPALAYQLLLYPVLDDRATSGSAREFTEAPIFDGNSNTLMWKIYLAGAPADGYLAPARMANLAGLPPTFVMAAELDPLRDEDLDYAGRLRIAGVPVREHLVPGTFHGFDAVVPTAAISRRARDTYVGAVREALADRKGTG